MTNMVQDEQKMAYHSQPETWQKYFGYNKFYDEVFHLATNMHKGNADAITRDGKYKLWFWKGDYWGLHSGGEMGLYKYSQTSNKVEHYDAVDFTVPMSISLYSHKERAGTETVFHWSPVQEQWWATGFSGYNEKFKTLKVEEMEVIGCVDLSRHIDIYNALKGEGEKGSYELIFDDRNHLVWLDFYEGVEE